MDAAVLNWITNRLNRGLKGEDRVRFLKHLKTDDPALCKFVEDNLLEWCTIACMELRSVVYTYDHAGTAQEVVRHLKQCFASEVAAA